jgi:transposase
MDMKRKPSGGGRGRSLDELKLTPAEESRLQEWARSGKTAQAQALRARIVLGCAQGVGNREVARQLSVTPQTVGKWRARFLSRRLQGLLDEPRPGAPRRIEDATVEAIIAKTLHDRPAHASRWSARAMAREMDLSGASVVRIWRAFGLQPRRRGFSTETEFHFDGKALDVAGVYVSSGIKAIALCTVPAGPPAGRTGQPVEREGGEDEPAAEDKAPDSVPGLAALDVAARHVSGPQQWRRGAQAFLVFLAQIDATVPPESPVHVIMSSNGLHPHAVDSWMRRHPRFQRYLSPPRAAWTGQVERWFRLLCKTQQQGRRSAHQLESAIRDYLSEDTGNATPFVWIRDCPRNARN